jgi:hypothetical protein
MTLKYEDLVEIVTFLRSEGYEYQVPEPEVFRVIMVKRGASRYTIHTTAQALHRAGLMKPLYNGLWEIIGGGESGGNADIADAGKAKGEAGPVLPKEEAGAIQGREEAYLGGAGSS